MALSKKPSSGFKLGLGLLLLFSLSLRFWGLERFNTLVFDEVYYVKFAHNYLSQTPFFDGHPPLSKYLIAIGMWIGNQLPIGRDAVNSMAGTAYSTWSYRWLNALTGSLMPLVVSGLAWQLTHRYRYALLAGWFAALDGLFLVESRYALNNIYLDIFGLLGLWCLLLALESRRLQREAWLALSGIWFGASLSVKWNGLWFLLAAYGLWIATWLTWPWRSSYTVDDRPEDNGSPLPLASPLENLTQLKIWQVGLNWAVIPAVFYWLSWIPHLKLNPKTSFWELQQQILRYHESVGSGMDIHPYCSTWFSWLVMLRPVAYFYQITDREAPLPTGKSTLAAAPDRWIYDVHAMGNPVLWWLSTAAMVLVLVVLVQQAIYWMTAHRKPAPSAPEWPVAEEFLGIGEEREYRGSEWSVTPTERWLALFLAINYGANLLPWVRVTRCIFLYHYMGAAIFATMAIAWFVDRWLSSNDSRLRVMAIATVLAIGLAFLFWLPVYLGLPLSPSEFQLRMWFRSWV
jgi:dolichyl-phosphate-mannose-protein mannosyltransferase